MAQYQTLRIDLSGRGGLAPRFWGDMDRDIGSPQQNLRYIAGEGQMVDGYYNPFRRYGYLSAANTYFKDVDQPTTFTGVPNCVVYDDVNDDIIFGSDGRYFQQLDGLNDVQLYLGASMGDLTTTGTPTIKDLDIYQINGVRKLFVVYEKSNLVEVGYYPLAYDSGAGTDAFFSTQGGGSLSFARTAFMRVADNGFAYLFTDNTVHRIDGTSATGSASGTVYPNILVFPPTFTIADAIDFKGSFFIGLIQAAVVPSTASLTSATYNLPCGVYVWNRQSTSVSTVDYVPIFGIRAINKLFVTHEGRLRAMVTSGEGVTEIREYNGATFVPVVEIGRKAHPVYHDSVTQHGGMTTWLAADGNIYSHGKVAPSEPDALFKIGKLAETVQDTGAIFYGGSNTYSTTTGYKKFRAGLYLGYLDNSFAPKVKQWDMFGTGAASNSASSENVMLPGDVYTPLSFMPPMSKIVSITVYMAPGSGSGSTSAGTISIYFNGSATAWATKTVTRDEHASGYKFISVGKPYVNAIQLKVTFPDSVTIAGNFDIAPAFAIVEYEANEDL